MAGVARGARDGRSMTARSRARPPYGERRTASPREPVGGENRLGANASFTRAAPTAPWSLIRLRPGPLLIALVVTSLWFVVNLRRLSPLDILPFAWTWLTLWLALSIGLELWRRYLQPTRPRRRRS